MNEEVKNNNIEVTPEEAEKRELEELEALRQIFLKEDEGFSWYFLNVLTTQEEKVRDRIVQYVEDNHLENEIYHTLLPEVNYYEINKGIKEEKSRKLYPGYLLIKIKTIMSSEDGEETNLSLWYQMRQINGVIDFVGTKQGHIPIPVLPSELLRIFKVKKRSKEKRSFSFSLGDKVKVVKGPFTDFIGEISDVYEEKLQLKIMISIFGRLTPVTIAFEEVEKI